jgi:hypothetical protein
VWHLEGEWSAAGYVYNAFNDGGRPGGRGEPAGVELLGDAAPRDRLVQRERLTQETRD